MQGPLKKVWKVKDKGGEGLWSLSWQLCLFMYLNSSLRCPHFQMSSSFLQLWWFSCRYFIKISIHETFSTKLFFILGQIRFPLSKDSSPTIWTCQDTGLVTSTCPLLSRAHRAVIFFTECLELIWCHFLSGWHSLSSRNTRLWLHRRRGKKNYPGLQLVFLILPCWNNSKFYCNFLISYDVWFMTCFTILRHF